MCLLHSQELTFHVAQSLVLTYDSLFDYWIICDGRMPRHLWALYGELIEGKQLHGGQNKRFKDTIDTYQWELQALNHVWHPFTCVL